MRSTDPKAFRKAWSAGRSASARLRRRPGSVRRAWNEAREGASRRDPDSPVRASRREGRPPLPRNGAWSPGRTERRRRRSTWLRPGRIILPMPWGPSHRVSRLRSRTLRQDGGLADVALSLPGALESSARTCACSCLSTAGSIARRYGLRLLVPDRSAAALGCRPSPSRSIPQSFPAPKRRLFRRLPPLLRKAVDLHQRPRRAAALPLLQPRGLRELPATRLRSRVLHANDWQTALVPLLRKPSYSWDRLFQTEPDAAHHPQPRLSGIVPASRRRGDRISDRESLRRRRISARGA